MTDVLASGCGPFSIFFFEEEDKSVIYQGTRVDLCITMKKTVRSAASRTVAVILMLY